MHLEKWDPYGISTMTSGAIGREIKRLEKLASISHHRCPECEILPCPNPYENLLTIYREEFRKRQAKLAARFLDRVKSFWLGTKNKLSRLYTLKG